MKQKNMKKNDIKTENVETKKEVVVVRRKYEKTEREKYEATVFSVGENNISNIKNKKRLNLVKFFQNVAFIFLVFCVVVMLVKIIKGLNDQDSFHSVSLKAYRYVSDKTLALNEAYARVQDVVDKKENMSPTNLNLAKVYETVVDEDDKLNRTNDPSLPVPITMEESKKEPKSAAFDIFEKLQARYQAFNQELYNLCDMNPVMVVRQYHYDGYSIIGKYNPADSSHVKGKRHTYFIPNFSNVNVRYFDGDGNEMDGDNNIKDIMSMASVYTYYHDPYDTKTFLKYSYDLFDNSYRYVASISEVYYCSGCMHYEPEGEDVSYNITLDKIAKTHKEQNVAPKQKPYKAGTLTKMGDGTYTVKGGSYDEYLKDIYSGKNVTDNNYCPGHIDLNIYVSMLTLDASNGLTKIDKNYGNKGAYFTVNWHGWEPLMIQKARELSYQDWEKEYGISVSYIEYIKPLTQEEINYYLNRLDKNLTPNRKKVIEIALKSVGRIPYYYGGKTSKAGFETNNFGSKVQSDYKGRCLKGLDCSGWISWVYLTAFNKYIVKAEGTGKLATEGTKITRKELLPGDVIVRPGIDSHVMMFLEWAPNGQMRVIHENGSVNNVSIATFDAYYPHYRRILNT